MHSRTAWSDYFTGSPTNFNSTTYGSRQTPSDSNIHISNCLFRSISSGSFGGALSCTSMTCLLVESTSFFSCKTSSSSGGAIYFSNSGQCVLYEICGYDCCSTHANSYNQFAYIQVNSAALSKNYINYSSIVRCVSEISGSHPMLNLGYGKICCPSTNISMNKCHHYSGIYCWPSVDSNSFTCSFSYSSFTDNTAIQNTCIHFWSGSAKFEIKNCNILRNAQGNLGSTGTFYTYGNVFIEHCCILENKATNIFYTYSSTITLSNSTVDSFSNNGCLTTKNTITKSFIFALNHMSTLYCHSEYDSAGHLTPIIQTPSPSKNQKLYYTREKCFCNSRLSDFVSLLGVFIFNFIHVDSSSDPLY
jgi:hypothetical protein